MRIIAELAFYLFLTVGSFCTLLGSLMASVLLVTALFG